MYYVCNDIGPPTDDNSQNVSESYRNGLKGSEEERGFPNLMTIGEVPIPKAKRPTTQPGQSHRPARLLSKQEPSTIQLHPCSSAPPPLPPFHAHDARMPVYNTAVFEERIRERWVES